MSEMHVEVLAMDEPRIEVIDDRVPEHAHEQAAGIVAARVDQHLGAFIRGALNRIAKEGYVFAQSHGAFDQIGAVAVVASAFGYAAAFATMYVEMTTAQNEDKAVRESFEAMFRAGYKAGRKRAASERDIGLGTR